MKAILIKEFGGKEVLKYENVDKPTINTKEVLIESVATSVNFADIQTREGHYHAAGQPPIILGMDVAGVVEEVGSEVTNISVGDRVIAFPKTGSYAAYCVADAALTFILPNNIGFDEAAASPVVLFTAYNLVSKVAKMQKGETILIHAASGGIGTTAIQIAKVLGASKIIGTVGSKSKEQAVREAGADHALCYNEGNFVEEVNAITNGKGVDVILDSIAGEVGERSLECLASYGRLVNFGIASGQPANFRTNDLHASCRSVLGFSIGTTKAQRPEVFKQTADEVFDYLSSGKIKVKISEVFHLADAASAHALIEERKSTGKLILKIKEFN